MSRIGKKKIEIPVGTEVSINGSTFSVKGKEGELVRTFNDIIEITKEDNQISVNPKDQSKFARAM
jgi:large subunit ribosomal protein L6